MNRTLWIVTMLSLSACAAPPAPLPSPPPAAESPTRIAELERRAAQLELQLMERDAVIDSLNTRLDEALQEVVGAMGKLQSLATRAEAASAMAEADVALQSITGSGRDSPDSRQAFRLMEQSTAEFKSKNFGGALYLANQAKAAVRTYRLAGGRLGNLRAGEIPFAVPVKLRVSGRANVRNGPGTNFAVSFTAESSGTLSGLSYLGDWIRVTSDAGGEGWISRSLVVRRADTSR
ncbi:MAG TPA: SH3 domain-containing protein [Burkholderiales bacterium]